MPELLIEPMNAAAAWSALAPDGVTPSTEISMADENVHVRYGADGHSGRFSASAAAAGHLLRRTLPEAVDLSAFPELRLWLRASRAARGTPTQPFFLELRLGSDALAPDAPGNTWHRYLPVAVPDTWELHRLSLANLAPAVRGAVRTLQLRSLGVAPVTGFLDDVAAVRDELIVDLEAALQARLHHALILDGSPVPAVVHSPGGALPSSPFIRFTHLGVEYADARTPSTQVRSDFSAEGYFIRPQTFAYDLRYQVDVFATSRLNEARLLDLVLERLPPRGELLVNGVPLTIEMSVLPAEELLGGHRTDRIGIIYRIQAHKEIGAARAVRGVNTVMVETEMRVA